MFGARDVFVLMVDVAALKWNALASGLNLDENSSEEKDKLRNL